MKYILLFLATLFVAFFNVDTVYGSEQIAGSSAELSSTVTQLEEDTRVDKLRLYLQKYNSPLAPYAEDFVHYADENQFEDNWALVAAISGVESTYGKRIPQNSYNAWGWGIPTGAQSGIGFTDWTEGIATVSSGLKNNYMDRGAVTLAQIGKIYAPPSTTWAGKVEHIMTQIENQPLELELSI